MKEDEPDRLLRGKLEALILARLSVGDGRRSSARVSKALYGMVARRFSAVEWRERYEAALLALCETRQVEPKTLALTSAGKARLKAALGLTSAPRAADWREFKAKYLPRLFLPEKPAARRRAIDPRALVLAERLSVSLPQAGKTELDAVIEGVIEAWLKRELQLSGPVSLETVGAALLGRELGLRPRQTRAAVLRQSALLLSGATKNTASAVSDALTARWLCGDRASSRVRANGAGGRAGATHDGPSDDTQGPRLALDANKKQPLNAFNGELDAALDAAFLARAAAKIERAARGPRARAFGPNKVFIASVWESLAADPELVGLGEGGFKALLVEAHRRGLVDLSRADLVAAMDPGDVAASETRHRNATYHFIVRGASA